MLARAGLFTPLILFTMSVPPTTIAPVEPAETKASACPRANSLKANAIELSEWALSNVVGSSCIEITSSVCTILSSPENSILLSDIHFLISCSFPVKVISTLNSFEANAAPFTISSGALSPPNASITILIFISHFIKKFTKPFYRTLR